MLPADPDYSTWHERNAGGKTHDAAGGQDHNMPEQNSFAHSDPMAQKMFRKVYFLARMMKQCARVRSDEETTYS